MSKCSLSSASMLHPRTGILPLPFLSQYHPILRLYPPSSPPCRLCQCPPHLHLQLVFHPLNLFSTLPPPNLSKERFPPSASVSQPNAETSLSPSQRLRPRASAPTTPAPVSPTLSQCLPRPPGGVAVDRKRRAAMLPSLPRRQGPAAVRGTKAARSAPRPSLRGLPSLGSAAGGALHRALLFKSTWF